MTRADEKSKLSTPPSAPVTWEVTAPLECETIISEEKLSKHQRDFRFLIGPMLRVKARTWFEARAKAVRAWALAGIYVNPQNVRNGRIAA